MFFRSDFTSVAPAVASATAVAFSTPLYDAHEADATHATHSTHQREAPASQPQVKPNKLPQSLNVSHSGHSISTGRRRFTAHVLSVAF